MYVREREQERKKVSNKESGGYNFIMRERESKRERERKREREKNLTVYRNSRPNDKK